jgi:hypothetical protein
MAYVSLNPYHERIATTGNGYFAHNREGQNVGVYAVPHDFEPDPERGHVRFYADRPIVLLTPDEARTLAGMLTRAADRAKP